MNRKGFTLIEILIVVIIVGILASIGIPQYASSLEKARGVDAKQGLAYIYREEQVYAGYRAGIFTNLITNLGSDAVLNTRYWNFTIATPPTSDSFIATATRISGGHSGQTVTIDNLGNIAGNWGYR